MTIIDSDAFLDMPSSTQALYFHLGMRADDDGFINNPKKIQRLVGSSEDDLKLLIAKKFVIPFKSGIVVMKHWKIHNYIQSDRYKPTVYTEEKNLLLTKPNKSYSLPEDIEISTMDTECIQSVRLGKVRLGEVRDYYYYARERISSLHEQYFSQTLTEKEFEEIFSYVESWFAKNGMEDVVDVLEDVYGYAVRANAKNLNYIRGIFKTLSANSVASPDDYWTYQAEYDQKK